MRSIGFLVFAAVLALAGCGGSGGGGDEQRLTAAEFRTQADAICAETQTKLNAIEDPGVDPSTADLAEFGKLAAALEKVADLNRDQAKALEALVPPAAFEDVFDESMALLDEGVASLDDAAKAAKRGDQNALTRSMAAAGAKAAAANQGAARLGLKACGGG